MIMKKYRNKSHYVRRTTLGLGFAVFALLAAGCGNGSDPLSENETDLHDTPLCLQEISLETAAEEEQPETRASVNTWTSGTDKIGVVSYHPAKGYSDLTIHPYTYQASGWTAADPVYLGANPSIISLYYPYTADDTNPRKIGMKMQSYTTPTESEKSLSMIQIESISRTNAILGQQTLTHVYSRLKFHLSCDAGMIGATVRSITLKGYATTAYLDLINKECKSAGTDNFFYESPLTLSANSANTAYLSVLVPPATDLSESTPKLQIDVDGVILTCDLPKAPVTGNESHKITVKISARQVEVKQVTFEPWAQKTENADI